MKDDFPQVGMLTFSMDRTRPDGSIFFVQTSNYEKYPDATGVKVSIVAYLWIPEQGKSFDKYFKFENAELATNYASWDFSGNLTSDFHRKDLQEGRITLEASAMDVPTSGPLEAKLTLWIVKRSTGEVFSPQYKVGLISNQDVMEFKGGNWTSVHQNFPIKLPTSIPEEAESQEKIDEPEIMDYAQIALAIPTQTANEIEAMKADLETASNPNPDPHGIGVLGPVELGQVQPWYIDQARYEQFLSSGGLPPEKGFLIDSVHQYHQVLNEFLSSLWKLESNIPPIMAYFKDTLMMKDEYRNPPASDVRMHDGSDPYLAWSLQFVSIRILLTIIESLPGFEHPN